MKKTKKNPLKDQQVINGTLKKGLNRSVRDLLNNNIKVIENEFKFSSIFRRRTFFHLKARNSLEIVNVTQLLGTCRETVFNTVDQIFGMKSFLMQHYQKLCVQY